MSRMITIFCLSMLTTLTVCRPSFGDYSPPPLSNLLGASELVAKGTIIEVRDVTFVLKLERVLVGEISQSSIEIRQFADWTCASRWAPYAAGQQVWVFAQRAEKDRTWVLRSAGSEGEFPAIENRVVVHGYWVPGLEISQPAPGISGYAIDESTFIDVVKSLRRCFEATPAEGAWKSLRAICSERELDFLAKRSKLHSRVLGEATINGRPAVHR